MKIASRTLALLVSLSAVSLMSANTINQDGLEIKVNDFSANDKQKVIGTGDAKVQVKELNSLNIYPILVEITNNKEHTISLSPSSFSLTPHTLSYMKRWTPNLNLFEHVIAVAGGFFVGVGIISHLLNKTGQMYIPLGAVPLAYALYRKYLTSTDHAAWFQENMLSAEGVLINPGETAKKYVFFKQDMYDGHSVYMTLKCGAMQEIKVEIIAQT